MKKLRIAWLRYRALRLIKRFNRGGIIWDYISAQQLYRRAYELENPHLIRSAW